MEWQSFLLLVFFRIALIECKAYNFSNWYTSEVFIVEYSDIRIENRAYGRVYVSDHDYNTKAEVCALGFRRREAEALCRLQGYSLKYFLKVSPLNNSDFVSIYCFEYLNNFHKCEARRLGSCVQVVELHCYYEPFQTTTQRQFTVVTGHPDVSLLYGSQGPVFVRSNEHGYNLYVVCCTEFTLTDGEALCQSLGYSFYRFNCRLLGDFQIKTVDANCHSHNIQSCDFRSNGYCSRLVDLLCIDNTTAALQNATVNTNKTTAAVQIATDNTRVRLVGSSHMDRGTVEVLHNGRWGTICDDGFDKVDGDVICRMLGFDSAREVYHDFLMGPDRRPIWLVDVDCQGYESDISQCKSKGWGITYCGHLEDASVRCKNRISAFGNTSIRLVGSQYPDRGNIEVSDYWYGSWGTICGEFFNETTADDICRMLGYNFSRKVYSNAYFGPSEGTSLQCTVSENDIQCRSLWSDFKYCHRNDVVGIHCGYTDVRLVGSGHSDRGTIEVLHNGQWGTICDHNFDKEDGDVICRMLGFNSSSNVYSAAHFGQGYGPIWLNGVRCNGYETDVAECGSQGWGIHDCNHGEDAGVYCVNNASDYHGPSTDPCDSNICYNGGTCIPTYSGYKGYYCQCAYGFSGSNCTTIFEPCSSYPCLNGGTCIHNNGYPGCQCLCPSGYSGQNCGSYNGTYTESVLTVGCNENSWNVSVYLPLLFSVYPNLVPNDLYMGEESCKGFIDGNYLHFMSNYTTCGTKMITKKQNISYTNEIIYAHHDQNHQFGQEKRLRVRVDCYLPQREGTSGHLHLGHDITKPSAHNVTSSTQYTVHLQFYADISFHHPKPLFESKAGDEVYVRAFTDVNDDNIKMRLSDCYTTPTSSAYSSMKYFIIKNGCVIDHNAWMLSNSRHESLFVFQDYEYSTNPGSLYLHCNATFCEYNDYSANCEHICSNSGWFRSVRKGYIEDVFDGPIENVDGHNAVRLTYVQDTLNGKKILSGNSTLLVAIFVVFGSVILILTISIIVGKLKKRVGRKGTEVMNNI